MTQIQSTTEPREITETCLGTSGASVFSVFSMVNTLIVRAA